MHTTCTPAAQVQARDAGRGYKKLCVEMIADTEGRQGYGGQRSSQSGTQGGEQGVESSHNSTQHGTPSFLKSTELFKI